MYRYVKRRASEMHLAREILDIEISYSRETSCKLRPYKYDITAAGYRNRNTSCADYPKAAAACRKGKVTREYVHLPVQSVTR